MQATVLHIIAKREYVTQQKERDAGNPAARVESLGGELDSDGQNVYHWNRTPNFQQLLSLANVLYLEAETIFVS